MKYKLNEEGSAILVDDKGHPVVINDNGEEIGLDAIHLFSKIPSLQAEAKKYRENMQTAQKTLDKFKGIDDPEKAIEALEKVKSFDESQMMKIDEVDKLKASLLKTEQEKFDDLKNSMQQIIEEKQSLIGNQQRDIYNAMVSNQFSKSIYFSGAEPKTILNPEVAEAYFKDFFRVEKVDGKTSVVGYYDKNGEQKIFSKSKPGNLADFDEAVGEIINNNQSLKDYLKQSSGSGAPGSSKSSSKLADKKMLFELSPKQRLQYLREKGMTG